MMLRQDLRTDAQIYGKSASQAYIFVHHGRGVNRVYCVVADRLRGADIPRRAAHRPPHLLPETGHPPPDDVHPRLSPFHHRVSRRPRRGASSPHVQHPGDELHAGGARGGDTESNSRVRDLLQRRLEATDRWVWVAALPKLD